MASVHKIFNVCLIILHCVKSIQMWSFFWSVFSRIRTEYGDLRFKSTYSVRIQENTDQKKLRIWKLIMQCCGHQKLQGLLSFEQV